MKVSNKRQLMALLILGTLILAIGICLFLYFSRDPVELKDSFPHRNSSSGSIEFKKEEPKSWVRLQAISPYAQAAIILSEDWSFYQHEGFDSEQIRVAIEEAAFGRRMRGASTITQQLVKNVWLTEERTFWRKFHELLLAYRVDKTLEKRRILELYLNVIEFGSGIYGIRRASQYYFQKSPAELSPRESAFLAMLLPSPRRYSVSFQKKKLTPFAQERIHKILEKMRMGKAITPERYKEEVESRFQWESF